MSKSLDFNKLKKQYLTVTLADEDKTVLMISTPTKNILDDFLAMTESLKDENIGEEAIDELYNIVAKILSRNKGGIEITPNKVKNTMDFEDVIIFIRAYTDFISEVSGSKN